MDSEVKMLPCERCGELILYDGIKEFGADTYCEFCGSESPHTLLGNPVYAFLLLVSWDSCICPGQPLRHERGANFFHGLWSVLPVALV